MVDQQTNDDTSVDDDEDDEPAILENSMKKANSNIFQNDLTIAKFEKIYQKSYAQLSSNVDKIAYRSVSVFVFGNDFILLQCFEAPAVIILLYY